MNPVECQFEAEVLAAVLQTRWPERVDRQLREHAASCAICSDAAAVASAIDEGLDELRASANLPDASRVWYRAQLRARQEAVQTAARPITALQLVAFGCAVGLLGACLGATSTWFQLALKRIAANAAGIDRSAFLAAISMFFTEHGVVVMGLVALIFLVPTAVYFALERD